MKESLQMHGSSAAFVLLAVGLLTPSAWSQASPKPDEKTLAGITERGRLLAEYDQAAWHATDAVQALHPPDEKVGRYIAKKTDAGWVVDFGHIHQGRFWVAYEAVQSDGPTHYDVKTFEPERQDEAFNLAAAEAIDLSLQDLGSVNRPYNVAVLPAPAGGLYVYWYPAQTKTGVYPYGGDVRYLMSADGKTVVGKRRLHKSVLEFGSQSVPAGAKLAGGNHSHILSDLPEDTDVLLVLSRQPRVPEYVGAGSHVYKIAENGSISIVQ